MIVLREIIKKDKKIEITESKIYSPVGNLAERAKKEIKKRKKKRKQLEKRGKA